MALPPLMTQQGCIQTNIPADAFAGERTEKCQPITTSPSAVTWLSQALMEPPSTVIPCWLTFRVSLLNLPLDKSD